jgi:phage baseplate assembly protein W
MSMEALRAWRFTHPDAHTGQVGGLSISTRGRVQLVHGDAAVRQSIMLLLSTMPGERVGRPDYGCPLQWLIFSPNDDTTAGLAIHYVRQSIERWETRAEILRLDAGYRPNAPEVLDIYLRYRVRGSLTVDEIESALDLVGEGA